MIRWFATNGIAANFLMLGLLVAGVYTAFYRIPLEVTPTLSWDTVMIEMPYRGATAKDVERAILIPIEESLDAFDALERFFDRYPLLPAGVAGDLARIPPQLEGVCRAETIFRHPNLDFDASDAEEPIQ